jgi:hypothetical protein
MEVCLFGYLGHLCFLVHVVFYFLPLYLWLMGRAHKPDWTVTFLITSIFTVPISGAKMSGDFLHLVFAFSLCFLRVLSYYFHYVYCCSCMVRIKITAHPIIPIVSSEVESMASDEALEASAQC